MNAAATVASVRNMLTMTGWQEYENPSVKDSRALHRFVRIEYRKARRRAARADQRRPARSEQSAEQAAGPEEFGEVHDQGRSATRCRRPTRPSCSSTTRAGRCGCDIPREMEPVAKYYISAMAALGFHAPRDVPFSETNMVIKCESKDKDFVIVKLSYAGLSTHAELQGVAAEDRKAAGMP